MQLQSNISNFCGQYCIMYVYQRLNGTSFSDFLQNFRFDTSYNDWFVATYVKNILTFNPYKNYSDKNKLRCKRQCEVNKCL